MQPTRLPCKRIVGMRLMFVLCQKHTTTFCVEREENCCACAKCIALRSQNCVSGTIRVTFLVQFELADLALWCVLYRTGLAGLD